MLTHLFTVIIPSYNRQSFLLSCLESLDNQTSINFSVTVVDDGSTDNTKQAISLPWKFSLTYIYQENQERGAARNNGILNANSEYVYFLDSDDRLDPRHFELLAQYISIYPDHDIIAARHSLGDTKLLFDTRIENLRTVDPRLLLRGNPIACNFAIRKKSIVSLFSNDRVVASAEDWLFLLENSFVPNNPIYLLPHITVYMSDHDGRSMNGGIPVARARLAASNYFLGKVQLGPFQRAVLLSFSYYNSCIHHYIGRSYLISINHGITAFITYPSPGMFARTCYFLMRNLLAILRSLILHISH